MQQVCNKYVLKPTWQILVSFVPLSRNKKFKFCLPIFYLTRDNEPFIQSDTRIISCIVFLNLNFGVSYVNYRYFKFRGVQVYTIIIKHNEVVQNITNVVVFMYITVAELIII